MARPLQERVEETSSGGTAVHLPEVVLVAHSSVRADVFGDRGVRCCARAQPSGLRGGYRVPYVDN